MTKPRLEILLDALLSVKASDVVCRIPPNARLPLHDGEVTFGFVEPLSGQRLHKAAFRVAECRR